MMQGWNIFEYIYKKAFCYMDMPAGISITDGEENVSEKRGNEIRIRKSCQSDMMVKRRGII